MDFSFGNYILKGARKINPDFIKQARNPVVFKENQISEIAE